MTAYRVHTNRNPLPAIGGGPLQPMSREDRVFWKLWHQRREGKANG